MGSPFPKSFVGYFGDYVSYDPSITTSNYGVWMGSNASFSVSSTTQGLLLNGFFPSASSAAMPTHANGSTRNCVFFLGSAGGLSLNNTQSAWTSSSGYSLITTPSNGVLLLSPVYIMEGTGLESSRCLGHLPGLFKPLMQVAGDQTEVELTGGPYNGKKFMSVRVLADTVDSFWSMLVETTSNGW